jgi:hypothetical protein
LKKLKNLNQVWHEIRLSFPSYTNQKNPILNVKKGKKGQNIKWAGFKLNHHPADRKI